MRTTTPSTAPRGVLPLKGKLGWSSLLLSVALVSITLAIVDAEAVLTRLGTLDSRWLLPAFFVHVAQLAVLGLRYRVIARQMGHDIPWLRATTEYALSVFLNQVVPTGMLGDGVRALRQAKERAGGGIFRWLEVVALDRISGQMALWLIVLLTVPFSRGASIVEPSVLLSFSFGGGLLGFVAWWALNRVEVIRRRTEAPRRLMKEAFEVLLSPRLAVMHLGLSMLFTVLTLLQLYIAAVAVGVELLPVQFLWIGPLIVVAMSAPSFFGGWGVREGASALLFAAIGLGGSLGVLVSLAYGVMALLISLPGIGVLLLDPARVVRPLLGWTHAHAVSVVAGWALSVWLGQSEVLAGVASLSLLLLLVQSRSNWTSAGQFGWANLVTAVRLVIVILLLLGFENMHPMLLAGLGAAVLVLDGCDGWLARKFSLQSEFGARFDVEVDSLFVLVLSYLLWGKGQAEPWVMAAGLWRYLYVLAPLLVAPEHEDATRTRLGRYSFVAMLGCFFAALLLPSEVANIVASVGVGLVSVSFLWSFKLRYWG